MMREDEKLGLYDETVEQSSEITHKQKYMKMLGENHESETLKNAKKEYQNGKGVNYRYNQLEAITFKKDWVKEYI